MEFKQSFPWALTPTTHVVDSRPAREKKKLYEENFRYLRAARQSEFCSPWVLGQTIGWRISSPVDVTLSPLRQYEVDASEVNQSAAALGVDEVWLRSGTAQVMQKATWLHLYEFREGNQWGNMFLPNGDASFEWRLGWNLIDSDQSLMLIPSEQSIELGVLIGVFTPAVLARMERTGFSIAFRPSREIEIRRGQEIARLVAVHTHTNAAS